MLTGRVISEDARPLAGAVIQARTFSSEPVTTATDPDGRYAFDALPPGSYTVTATAEGFEPGQRFSMIVVTGRETRAGLILTPLSEEEAIRIRSIVNAASNLPGYLPQAAISPEEKGTKEKGTTPISGVVSQRLARRPFL